MNFDLTKSSRSLLIILDSEGSVFLLGEVFGSLGNFFSDLLAFRFIFGSSLLLFLLLFGDLQNHL